jgi:hypothetical protein
MKNITLSADEALIAEARRRARNENTSLNELFREWLARYVSEPQASDRYLELMNRLGHVQAGGTFRRDELNERH